MVCVSMSKEKEKEGLEAHAFVEERDLQANTSTYGTVCMFSVVKRWYTQMFNVLIHLYSHSRDYTRKRSDGDTRLITCEVNTAGASSSSASS
jgi:hypothetical protein